jgi:hypothetical protein
MDIAIECLNLATRCDLESPCGATSGDPIAVRARSSVTDCPAIPGLNGPDDDQWVAFALGVQR